MLLHLASKNVETVARRAVQDYGEGVTWETLAENLRQRYRSSVRQEIIFARSLGPWTAPRDELASYPAQRCIRRLQGLAVSSCDV